MATKPAMKSVEEELLDLEKQYWQAIKDKDVEAAMHLTDDQCIVTGPQGVARIDRETLAGMIKATPYELKDFQVSDDAQVLLLRDDAAILAYKVREELTVDGKSVTLEAADASAWVRRNGRWVCALHTESISGDPFGRNGRRKYRRSSGHSRRT
jgi:hypothetical protein